MNFNFYTDGKSKVIATASYKGEMVRAIAKCAPSDEFNYEIGKQLAQLRCEEKVARKRLQHKQFMVEVCRTCVEEEQKDLDRAYKANTKAFNRYIDAKYDREAFEEKLGKK